MGRMHDGLSQGEEALVVHLRATGIFDYVREHRPCPSRRWRLDFSFPRLKIGIEIHGGVWISGRHNRGGGMEADFEKLNWCVLNGWKMLAYSTQQVINGDAIRDIQALLGSEEPV